MQLISRVILAGAHIRDTTHDDGRRVLIVCGVHNALAFHLDSATVIEMRTKLDTAGRFPTGDDFLARYNTLNDSRRREVAGVVRLVRKLHSSQSTYQISPLVRVDKALSGDQKLSCSGQCMRPAKRAMNLQRAAAAERCRQAAGHLKRLAAALTSPRKSRSCRSETKRGAPIPHWAVGSSGGPPRRSRCPAEAPLNDIFAGLSGAACGFGRISKSRNGSGSAIGTHKRGPFEDGAPADLGREPKPRSGISGVPTRRKTSSSSHRCFTGSGTAARFGVRARSVVAQMVALELRSQSSLTVTD
jgi:hypothetical protein